jgi:hypothetical protein
MAKKNIPKPENYTTLLADAANTATPSARLEEIYNEIDQYASFRYASHTVKDREGYTNAHHFPDWLNNIGRILVKNPNIPPEKFVVLALVYPFECVLNTALDLFFIEIPQMFHRKSRYDLLKLLLDPNLPARFVQIFTYHPSFDVSQLAKRHITLAGEVPDNWQDTDLVDYLVQTFVPTEELSWLAYVDALPEWVNQRLHERIEKPSQPSWPKSEPLSPRELFPDCESHSEPTSEQLKIMEDIEKGILSIKEQKNFIYSDDTPPCLLRRLALHPKTPQEILTTLAWSRSTPIDALVHLSTLGSEVRHDLCINENMPDEIREEIILSVLQKKEIHKKYIIVSSCSFYFILNLIKNNYSFHFQDFYSDDQRYYGDIHIEIKNNEIYLSLNLKMLLIFLDEEGISVEAKRKAILYYLYDSRPYYHEADTLAKFLGVAENYRITPRRDYIPLAGAIGFCQRLPLVKPKGSAYEEDDQLILEKMAQSGDRWGRAIAKRKIKSSTWQFMMGD